MTCVRSAVDSTASVRCRCNVVPRSFTSRITPGAAQTADAILTAVRDWCGGAPHDDATVRADDHQVLQPLYVSVMAKQGGEVRFDNEGSGYGFRTVKKLKTAQTTLPTTCRMERPARN